MEQGEKLFLWDDGYAHLEGHLKALYGERGAYAHNLIRYDRSPEHLEACGAAQAPEDMREVSPDHLWEAARVDGLFREMSRRLIRYYDDLDKSGRLTADRVYEIAGVLGLAPGQTDPYGTLLPHVCDLFFTQEEIRRGDGLRLEARLSQKQGELGVMVREMLGGMRDGMLLQNPDGRQVFSQGYVRNLWRGEHAFFGSSRAYMYRRRSADPWEGKLDDVLGTLRIVAFALWIRSLDFVGTWPWGDVYHGAVAQHYGIPTNGMDVTGDFKTALFFACTAFDSEKGAFRKLRPDEYARRDSREHVARLNGDSRYGVLFKAPYDVIRMSLASGDPALHFTSASPIGYQPFMRCSNQRGFLIETGPSFDLYRDRCFTKYRFRLCPEVVDRIFEDMQAGVNVYPREAFGSIEGVVERIKGAMCFSEDTFDRTIRHMRLTQERDAIASGLKGRGVTIQKEPVAWCTEEERRALEARFWANWDSVKAAMPQMDFQTGFCT